MIHSLEVDSVLLCIKRAGTVYRHLVQIMKIKIITFNYVRKQNITFNFKFHMQEKNFTSVTSHALGPVIIIMLLDPFLCHRLSPPLGLPPPSSVMFFMYGPKPEIVTFHFF